MSFDELTAIISEYQNKEKENLKEKLTLNYELAFFIREFIATILSKDAKIPNLYESHEDLFEKEIKQFEEQKIKKDMEIYKEQMRAFAERYNASRR